MLDLVIRNGLVVDGSGLPGYKADIGVRGARIVRIGQISEGGRHEVDAAGKVVSPGFIDCTRTLTRSCCGMVLRNLRWNTVSPRLCRAIARCLWHRSRPNIE